MLGAGLGDPLSDIDVDEVKIISFLEVLAGAQQVDDYIGVFDHVLDEALVPQVGVPLHPGFVCMIMEVLVCPVTLSSLTCS